MQTSSDIPFMQKFLKNSSTISRSVSEMSCPVFVIVKEKSFDGNVLWPGSLTMSVGFFGRPRGLVFDSCAFVFIVQCEIIVVVFTLSLSMNSSSLELALSSDDDSMDDASASSSMPFGGRGILDSFQIKVLANNYCNNIDIEVEIFAVTAATLNERFIAQ